jgi:hypothetical protein
LFEEEGGAGKVIRSLAYLEAKYPQKSVIISGLAYFRKYSP